jgi:hypothetical protein
MVTLPLQTLRAQRSSGSADAAPGDTTEMQQDNERMRQLVESWSTWRESLQDQVSNYSAQDPFNRMWLYAAGKWVLVFMCKELKRMWPHICMRRGNQGSLYPLLISCECEYAQRASCKDLSTSACGHSW